MREKKRSVGRGRQRNQSSNINELATGCFSNFELLDLELLDGVLIFLALGDQILGDPLPSTSLSSLSSLSACIKRWITRWSEWVRKVRRDSCSSHETTEQRLQDQRRQT